MWQQAVFVHSASGFSREYQMLLFSSLHQSLCGQGRLPLPPECHSATVFGQEWDRRSSFSGTHWGSTDQRRHCSPLRFPNLLSGTLLQTGGYAFGHASTAWKRALKTVRSLVWSTANLDNLQNQRFLPWCLWETLNWYFAKHNYSLTTNVLNLPRHVLHPKSCYEANVAN